MGYLINLILTTGGILKILIVIRALISWIPDINYYKEPVKTIIKITDYIIVPIQSILMKYNLSTVIDISPIIAFFLINFLVKILIAIVVF